MKVILVMLIMLSGCAARQPVIPVSVPVVLASPVPPSISRPALPIYNLSAGDDAGVVMRAYVVSVKMLMGYVQQLEIILDGYR